MWKRFPSIIIQHSEFTLAGSHGRWYNGYETGTIAIEKVQTLNSDLETRIPSVSA